jgi:transposase
VQNPARPPLSENLPRERIVYPAPTACPCCGGTLHKLGEDVTEMLELVPPAPPSGRCALSRSATTSGPSRDRTRAAGAPPPIR